MFLLSVRNMLGQSYVIALYAMNNGVRSALRSASACPSSR